MGIIIAVAFAIASIMGGAQPQGDYCTPLSGIYTFVQADPLSVAPSPGMSATGSLAKYTGVAVQAYTPNGYVYLSNQAQPGASGYSGYGWARATDDSGLSALWSRYRECRGSMG